MSTKFIKLKDLYGNEENINPTFITNIKRLASEDHTIIYIMGGGSIDTNETVQEIMDKIKKAESFYISFNK
jgi:uncharacterized protein YlzI (FlbEa/FlbD family)